MFPALTEIVICPPSPSSPLFSLIIRLLFVYFWPCCGCRCARVFSGCGEQGLLSVAVGGRLLALAPLVAEHRLQVLRLQQLHSWALGSWAVLWNVGLVVLQHGGSSQAKDQTGVPCIARWILNHQTTRETSVSLMVENAQLVYIRKCTFPLQLGKRLYPWPTCWRVLL